MFPSVNKPKVLVSVRPKLYERLFGHVDSELRAVADLTYHSGERDQSSHELSERISQYDAVITGWGTPTFDERVMMNAERLRLVAHSAGSIRHMIPREVFSRGVQVTHAAAAIAPAVADMSLLLIMMMLRHVPAYDRAMHAGESWQDALRLSVGDEIIGTRIGVVGAGYTGRCLIKLLRAVEAEIWVCDPYLTPVRAAEMGVRKVDLNELLSSCQVVTLQAPSTPETHKMIGAKQLASMQNGAILINTARPWLVDETALLAELRSGRISAGLDVFEDEPLPIDSPFRGLPNTVLLPHVAGGSRQTALRQGRLIVDEIGRYCRGEPLRHAVTPQTYDTMA